MSNRFKTANLVLVLILAISLYVPSSVNAASQNSSAHTLGAGVETNHDALYSSQPMNSAPPASPSFGKKSPANQTTGINPSQVKLEWNAVSNVFRYVYCYHSTEITSNVCDIDDKATWISNGTSTSVQLPALLASKNYSWQVGAKLNDNSFIYANGALTSKWSFTTSVGSGGAGAGFYDNTHINWVFTGKWAASTYTGTETGPYNKTYKESRDIPDYATFTFTGGRLALYYTQLPERGIMNIYMDNSTTPIVLDQSGPQTWQKAWRSDPLTTGTHTIKLVYVSGNAVDIDAIQIFAQADTTPPGAINLSTAASTGAGTVTLNWTAVGDDGTTPGGAATTYLVRYSTNAIVTETDWNNATVVSSGVPTPKTQGQAETTTVSGLTPGQPYYFAVRAQDEQFNVGVISNSPSAIAYQPPPAGIGIYDDANPVWAYSGNWSTHTGTGPYANTLHYSNASNAKATFVFQGPAKFVLTYTADTNRGNILVSVDGGEPVAINAKSTSTRWQQIYISDVYNDTKSYTVTISSPGTGTYIDVDAIQVVGPIKAGKYDDAHVAWTYSGSWSTHSGTGPYANTLHYSKTADATAKFMFQGPAKFILTYTADTNRGNILVSVDGSEPVLINANGPSTLWQQTYISDLFSDSGTHTVVISSPGTGTYIDVDAVQIAEPMVAGNKYDDMHVAWAYEGSWGIYNGSGPHANTLHYSNASNAKATFVFQGPAKFVLTYTADTNRGNILVSVDGGEPVTIDARGTSTRWQQTYISDLFSDSGTHTVVISSPGTGTYIDVDAVQIAGLMVAGNKYDDMHAAWAYEGSWGIYNGLGPHAYTLHYSNASNAKATFVFQGSAKFILTYSVDSNRSNILVSVDGGEPVLIDANGPSTLWQQTYTSDVYPDSDEGTHTVVISGPGTGTYIDVDAVEIVAP